MLPARPITIASAIIATLLALSLCANALQLRTYSPTRHDRFTGFPSSPVPSTTFIHKDVDLTGVGWRTADSQPRSLTLVSPKYFVGARHFRPIGGSTIRFVANDGTIRDYTVLGYHNILNDDPPGEGGPKPTDLSLGELVAAVPPTDGINAQPYLNLSSEAAYLSPPNNQLIVLGKSARGGIATANSIGEFFGTPVTSGGGINNTRTIEFAYQDLAGLQDDAAAESGDSGSPILVKVNNRGAIVGIHTAVLTAAGTTTTIDSFVAHPPYISQINAIMASDGYHMIEANPASIVLNLTPIAPSPVRAGYPTVIDLDLTNADPSNAANNLRISLAFPPASTGVSTSGTQWIADLSPTSLAARKGGLPASQSTNLSTTFTPSTPGSYSLAAEYSADEFAAATQMIPLEVIESYLSWSAGLSDPDPNGDFDLDGLSNLFEYAFGGNPEQSSAFQPNGITPLAPTLSSSSVANEYEFKFVRRKDALLRALTYDLESSPTLQPTTWSDAATDIIQTQTTSIDDDFEQVTLSLSSSATANFYRLAVTLAESS